MPWSGRRQVSSGRRGPAPAGPPSGGQRSTCQPRTLRGAEPASRRRSSSERRRQRAAWTDLRVGPAGTDAAAPRGDRVGVEGPGPFEAPDRRQPEAAHPSGCEADGTGCLPTDSAALGPRKRAAGPGSAAPLGARAGRAGTDSPSGLPTAAATGSEASHPRVASRRASRRRGVSLGRRQTNALRPDDPAARTATSSEAARARSNPLCALAVPGPSGPDPKSTAPALGPGRTPGRHPRLVVG